MWLLPRILAPGTPAWQAAALDSLLLGSGLALFVGPVLLTPLRRRLAEHRDRLTRGVAQTAAVDGEAYHEAMVRFLGEHLGAACVIVGELRSGQTIRTLASWTPGGPIESFEYDLAGTPCEVVSRGEVCCYARGVAAHFPGDLMLADMGAQSYIGAPMWTASGEMLGVVAVVGAKPLTDPESAALMVRLLAARAGTELLRSRANRTGSAARRRELALEELISTAALLSVTDASGEITHVNDQFCEVSGFSREELLGQNHRMVNSGRHGKELWADLYRKAAAGKVWQAEVENRRKNGSPYWVVASTIGVLDDDRRLLEIISVRFDITAIREAELRSRSLAAAMAATSDGVALVDDVGDILYCNRSMERMLGVEEGRLIGSPVWTVVSDPASAARLESAVREDRDEVVRSVLPEAELSGVGGMERWVEVVVTPCDRDAGGIEGFVCACRDVTEQEAEERALRYEADLAALRAACLSILSVAGRPFVERVRELLAYVGSDPALGFGETGAVFVVEHGEMRTLVTSGGADLAVTTDDESIVLPLEYQGEHLGELMLAAGATPVCVQLRGGFAAGLAEMLGAALRTEQLRERAEQVRREQEGTLYAMGKEMRTPMTSIVAAADMLKEPDIEGQEREELTEMVRRNADHLLSVVDNVLDLAGVSSESTVRQAGAVSNAGHATLRGARVLLIEDFEDVAAAAVRSLRECGAIVEVSRRSVIGMSMALSAWRAGRAHALVVMTARAALTDVDVLPRLLREAGYTSPIVVLGDGMSRDEERAMLAAGSDRVVRGTARGREVIAAAVDLLGGNGGRLAA